MLRGLLILLLLLSYVGCAQQDPLERSFDTALRRMSYREPPTKRRVAEVFAAFDALQSRDFREARLREANPLPSKWPELYPLYLDMQQRLERIEPLLPLGATSNYRGGYSLAVLRTRIEEARLGAGDYYHTLAAALYFRARAGDKLAARAAYGYLDTALTYVPEREQAYATPIAETYALGLVHVSVYLSGDRELVDVAWEQLQGDAPGQVDWTVLHYEDYRGEIDFEAEIGLIDASSCGPSKSTGSTTYSKEVLDYVEKQEYEERINDSTVVKKVREIEHFKTVSGTVTEVSQSYEVSVRGEMLLYNTVRRRPEPTTELRGSADWSNNYSVCSGDSEALSGHSCFGSASSAPSERWMLSIAIAHLLNDAHHNLYGGLLP